MTWTRRNARHLTAHSARGGAAGDTAELFGLECRAGREWEFGALAGKDRYFRAAFTHPVRIGTIYTTLAGSLTAGAHFQQGIGVSLSYLKPTAPYPGDVTADEQWVRVPDDGALKTLPPGVTTRALRVSDRYLQPQTFTSHVRPMLLFQERYYSALELGQSKVAGREGKPESWLGVWNKPVTVVALLAEINTTSVTVEMLKPGGDEPAAIASPERWKHLKDFPLTRGFSLYQVDKPFESNALRLTHAYPRPYQRLRAGAAAGEPGRYAGGAQPAGAAAALRLPYDMPMDGFIALQISDAKTEKWCAGWWPKCRAIKARCAKPGI